MKPNNKSAEADAKLREPCMEDIPDIGHLGLSYKTTLYMHVPPKYCAFSNLHGIKTKKTMLFIYLFNYLLIYVLFSDAVST
jgi:hypothetical protein